MADRNKACEVKIKATIDGKERWVTRLTAHIEVGASSWPAVEIVTHKPKDAYSKAEQLATTDVAKDMGKRQNKMFSERSQADVNIRITVPEDPDAGSFTFKGLISGPVYTFGPYSVSQSDTCVPEYALVESLSYSIYSPDLQSLQQEQADPCLDDSGTICALINDMQHKLRQDYSPDSKDDSADKQYTEAQHKINEKVAKHFEDLLHNSAGEKKFGWEKILDALKDNDCNLRRVIWTILLQTPGPFSSVIERIAEAFMCIYVPEWDDIGRFVNKYNLFNKTEELELVICGIYINTASGFGLLPTGFVGVNSPYLMPGTVPQEASKHFVVYPKENAEQGRGIMHQTLGPAWITEEIATEEGSPQDIEREQGVEVTEAESKVKEIKKSDEEVAKRNLTVLEEWGKAQYIHLALAKSQVQVQVPLTFKPKVGKFYRVRAKGKGNLFKGVLTGITHNISVDGNTPAAATLLEFSYVQMEGFSLPHA